MSEKGLFLRSGLMGVVLFFPFVIGCSGEKGEDKVQKIIERGTGKTQVDTYQNLKKQIRSIKREKDRQLQ